MRLRLGEDAPHRSRSSVHVLVGLPLCIQPASCPTSPMSAQLASRPGPLASRLSAASRSVQPLALRDLPPSSELCSAFAISRALIPLFTTLFMDVVHSGGRSLSLELPPAYSWPSPLKFRHSSSFGTSLRCPSPLLVSRCSTRSHHAQGFPHAAVEHRLETT